MSESKSATDHAWVDPDEAPEWTDEMFDKAELSVGGKIVRAASGALGSRGAKVEHKRLPRAIVGRVYASVRAAATGRSIMAVNEKTGKKAGTAASKVLKNSNTGKDSKSAAGSALTQRPDKKKK
jgi:hypothetical protein